MNISVIDLHCDTALELLNQKGERIRRLRRNELAVSLERGKRLGRYAQFFAVFTTPGMNRDGGLGPEAVFSAVLNNLLSELEENSDLVARARTARDIEAITAQGKIAAVLSLEGPAGIGFDPGRLDELAELGFRMATLTWNEQNPLAGSHATGGGLTAQGREFVRRAQSLGILLDVSHLGERAFWDLMNVTRGPVSASHSNCRAVHGVTRNLTDEQFRAICETGGVAGVNLYSSFLGSGEVTLDTVCRHILHWLELGGEKNIALGGDLDGCESLPLGFSGVDCYAALAEKLLAHGVSRQVVEDIFWNNALNLLKE